MDIGSIIKQARKSAGLTQMQLANELGLTYQQVQKYENGSSQLTLKRTRQLAEALKVPPSMFVSDDAAKKLKWAPKNDLEASALKHFRKIKNKGLAVRMLKLIADEAS